MTEFEALYERAIVEVIETPSEKKSLLEGISKPGELTKVKVHSWGTDIVGEPFLQGQEGNEAYIKVGTQVIPFGENRVLVDRRYILAFKRN